MIRDGKSISHSGVGAFWGNLIAWAVCFVIFLGSIFVLGWWTFGDVWIPGLICMVLSTVAFFVPQHVIGRSDTINYEKIHAESNAVHRHGH